MYGRTTYKDIDEQKQVRKTPGKPSVPTNKKDEITGAPNEQRLRTVVSTIAGLPTV